MDTSRIDGVKAPPHDGTPRAAPIVISAGSVLTIFSIFSRPTKSNTSLMMSDGLPSFLTSLRSLGLMPARRVAVRSEWPQNR
jgi:hypothetical protein